MKKINNFLPNQYKQTEKLPINHNYLREQFRNSNKIFHEIKMLNFNTDYTLGKKVNSVEKKFAKITNCKYAIGVGSGTDAITLSLKSLGIKSGDEVITPSYTFYATVGAIVQAGAKPVFVDISDDLNIDISKIEKSITPKTKAIVPVHWSGQICDMKNIRKIAKKNKLFIVEDACHAIKATRDNYKAGKYSDSACFSMHPLKNLNVWGDGGFMLTQNKKIAEKLYLLRNHGLINRDTCKVFGFNSRLDTIQAVVGNYKIENKLNNITNKRIKNALLLDKLLKDNPNIITVKRKKNLKEVFHLYHINVKKNRDRLKSYLLKNNIDAKIHYPRPIHLQPAAKFLKYKKGDFPIAEKIAKTSLSLPVHEFIKKKDIHHMAKLINKYLR